MTNKEERDKLFDKIRKLMALSTSPNENEAAAAAAKVQAILAEHNLAMGDVTSASLKKDIKRDAIETSDSFPWRRIIGGATAALYFCKYVYWIQHPRPGIRTDVHTFFGAPHNLEVAKMMFSYLIQTVERLAVEAAAKYTGGSRASFKTSFKNACADRLSSRMWVMMDEAKKGKAQASSGTGTNLPALASLYEQTALVLKDFLDELFEGALKSKPQKSVSKDLAGRIAGYKAGNEIGLDPQLGGNKEDVLRIGNG